MDAPPRDRIKLYEIMVLIAGLALGLWIGLPLPRDGGLSLTELPILMTLPLGGLSVAGIPLMLAGRRAGRRRPFGAGQLLWFAHGMAACLLWPPVVYLHFKFPQLQVRSTNLMCFLYASPLLSLFLLPALAAGGWLRRRRRRRATSWKERFGFGLTLAWAAVGLYVLGMFYLEDFRR